ncbi:MAG: hypothetical protein NW224_23970, partial [Leptolyngbyaceae cyanobacterium bins.302]|nr:hypothetical protein [Leptolyngbyaceae cyanobacterium bins.302]
MTESDATRNDLIYRNCSTRLTEVGLWQKMVSFCHEGTASPQWTKPRRKGCPDWRAVAGVA